MNPLVQLKIQRSTDANRYARNTRDGNPDVTPGTAQGVKEKRPAKYRKTGRLLPGSEPVPRRPCRDNVES